MFLSLLSFLISKIIKNAVIIEESTSQSGAQSNTPSTGLESRGGITSNAGVRISTCLDNERMVDKVLRPIDWKKYDPIICIPRIGKPANQMCIACTVVLIKCSLVDFMSKIKTISLAKKTVKSQPPTKTIVVIKSAIFKVFVTLL